MPHIKKRMRICETRYNYYLKDSSKTLERLKYYDMLHSRQAEYLIGESGFPIYDGTSTEYLSPGEEMFTRLLEELEKAEKYIFLEFFILAEGQMWDAIHSILRKKAAQGVEVKIIFDDFGSIMRQHKNFINDLKSEKIHTAVFNPINPVMNIFMKRGQDTSFL